jgi:hypothetical protein
MTHSPQQRSPKGYRSAYGICSGFPSISSAQNTKKYTFTVEVYIDELTTTYLEAMETNEPDSLKSMIEHECHWIEGSGLYVREIKEVTEVLPS